MKHPQKHFCDQCDYKATRMKYLKRHVIRSHDSKEIKPSIAANLEYSNNPSIHSCDKCDYIGARLKYLKRHVRKHHGRNKEVLSKDKNIKQPVAIENMKEVAPSNDYDSGNVSVSLEKDRQLAIMKIWEDVNM